MPARSGKIYRMKRCESPSLIKPEYQAQQPSFSDANRVISDGSLAQYQGGSLNLRFGQSADVGQEMPEELKSLGPWKRSNALTMPAIIGAAAFLPERIETPLQPMADIIQGGD